MKLLFALLALAGCALTRDRPPVTVHYYEPPLATPKRISSTETPQARVRLGRIETSAHLRFPIAYRVTPVQLEVYDLDRWTDTPDAYVERSLENALFASRPLQEATGGDVLVLDIEVLGFEEVRGPPPSGLVQLRYRLRDDRTVIATETITVVRKARSAELVDVVAALGQALDDATARLADHVLETSVAYPVHTDDKEDVSRRRLQTRR
jgi:ABC-type uncharacterized transport system auxiliary subunit